MIQFTVSGHPEAQGSMNAFVPVSENADINAACGWLSSAFDPFENKEEPLVTAIIDRLRAIGKWPVYVEHEPGAKTPGHFVATMRASNATKLNKWRNAIAKAAMTAYRFDCEQCVANKGQPYVDAVRIDCWFYFQRPKGDFSQSQKTPGLLKASAKPYVLKDPDEDKLRRAVLDALKMGGVIHDDNRSQGGLTWKQFNPRRDDPEGVRVQIWFADEIAGGATLERRNEREL